MEKVTYLLTTERGRKILKTVLALLALSGLALGGAASDPGIGPS
jgi:hypothetical protein